MGRKIGDFIKGPLDIMKLNEKELLVCDCEGTMSIDIKNLTKSLDVTGELALSTQLCRKQMETFERAAKGGGRLLVACTQEAPLFLDSLAEIDTLAPNVEFFNIRETAGWSEHKDDPKFAKNLSAKMTALIAEAALDIFPSNSITMKSDGRLIVLGKDETAIELAKKISGRLEPTVVLTTGSAVIPPNISEVPIFSGEISSASGHLGNFKLAVTGFAVAIPSSKEHLNFEAQSKKVELECDLILDVRGETPLFNAAEKRDGYQNPHPDNKMAVAMALVELIEMIGEFEKPRYIDYDSTICAHSASRIKGCTRCIDVCPTSAIKSNQDTINFDPYVCAGCGNCASVCPTGAARYTLPSSDDLMFRLRTLLNSYRRADGVNPQILIYDNNWGIEIIAAMARFGPGLPSNMIPFRVNQVSMIGLDFVLTAAALGAERTIVLMPPSKVDELSSFESELHVANIIFEGLGYGSKRAVSLCEEDPDILSNILHKFGVLPGTPEGTFISTGRKRSILRQSLNELHSKAPNPISEITLPVGSPFGAIEVDVGGCTLCLACVGACPMGALKDHPDKPSLSFMEDLCVQCGLCKNTCPEKVITLKPRLNFLEVSQSYQVIKEEEPFECIKCQKPFATKATIEKMTNSLKNHAMFSEPGAIERLSMCDDCRIIDMATNDTNPLASGAVPIPKTTDDYLREREELKRRAEEDMKKKNIILKNRN